MVWMWARTTRRSLEADWRATAAEGPGSVLMEVFIPLPRVLLSSFVGWYGPSYGIRSCVTRNGTAGGTWLWKSTE